MNFEEIKELIKIFDESKLTSLNYKQDDFKLELSKVSTVVAQATPAPMVQAVQAPASAPTQAPATTEAPKALGTTINAPMVGTLYRSPSPEASVFVKVGDVVKKGQTLCILEAMKIMNEIEAEFDCKILNILVEDGRPVEYNMPIFEVEKV